MQMVKKLRLTMPVGVIAEVVEVAADSVEAAVVVVSVEVVVDTIAMAVPDTVEAAAAVSGAAEVGVVSAVDAVEAEDVEGATTVIKMATLHANALRDVTMEVMEAEDVIREDSLEISNE